VLNTKFDVCRCVLPLFRFVDGEYAIERPSVDSMVKSKFVSFFKKYIFLKKFPAKMGWKPRSNSFGIQPNHIA